jgi:LysR family transcriptional regulator, glycine cleavage system transcriptional activator
MKAPISGTRSLRVFEAAGRHLSFTRAAAELNVTPAAVSHQIKEFETQMGMALFARANRALTLTTGGTIFYEATVEALAALANGVARAQRAVGRRQLRITATSSIAAKWLIPRLHQFARLEPESDIRVEVSCEMRELETNDADVDIRFGNGLYPGVRVDRLFEHQIFPVCSPAFLRSNPELQSPSDLLRLPLIHQTWIGQGVTWPDWRTWMQAAGIDHFEAKPGLFFEATSYAIQAAIEGKGIALGDYSLVADDLTAGLLVQPFALAINGPPDFAYFMCSPPNPPARSLVPAFREWILREARATLATSVVGTRKIDSIGQASASCEDPVEAAELV